MRYARCQVAVRAALPLGPERAAPYVHRRVTVYGAPSSEGHQRVPHAPKRPDGVPPHAGLSPEELQGLPLAMHAQLPETPMPYRSRHKALRGFVWVDASANRVATVYASAPLCNRRLTERRTLGVSLSRKGALCVWASPKGALCMRAVAQSAPFREGPRPECTFP